MRLGKQWGRGEYSDAFHQKERQTKCNFIVSDIDSLGGLGGKLPQDKDQYGGLYLGELVNARKQTNLHSIKMK